MVNPDDVSFPITGERLAELQGAEVGRELTPMEREMFAEISDMANEAYEAATRGDAETVQVLLDAINHVPTPDDYTRHVAALCRGWVLLGCQRGMEILKAVIDRTSGSDEGGTWIC